MALEIPTIAQVPVLQKNRKEREIFVTRQVSDQGFEDD